MEGTIKIWWYFLVAKIRQSKHDEVDIQQILLWPFGTFVQNAHFCYFDRVIFDHLVFVIFGRSVSITWSMAFHFVYVPTSWNPILYLRFYRIWSIQYGLFHSAEHLNVTVKTEAFSFWPICKWLFIISIHISDFESLPLLWIKMKRSKQTL